MTKKQYLIFLFQYFFAHEFLFEKHFSPPPYQIYIFGAKNNILTYITFIIYLNNYVPCIVHLYLHKNATKLYSRIILYL